MSKENERSLPTSALEKAVPEIGAGEVSALDGDLNDASARDLHASGSETLDLVSRDVGFLIDGKYKLIELIAEGGMGAVWLAEQREPVKRKVAIKLIKPGMDSRAVLARFDAERQALALMDHPNIAKVLDGGVAENGRPYFVMELVKGLPITQFCDAHRLKPAERLELFIPVCEAIQHAHQKGIIHRDIKPSNVLVAMYDDRPIPKVIDFGVAKATGGMLTEQTLNTGFGAIVGTPEYMSPEQATLNSQDIDTRSDVYSLGVMLYELLVGSPPFRSAELRRKGLIEILRVIREDEPPLPSLKLSSAEALPSISACRNTEPKSLTGLLRAELDWVVMKALEKNRVHRYESVGALSSDLKRFLAFEPVTARPYSLAYRVRKSIRKHRGIFTAIAAVSLVLIAGIVVSSGLAVQTYFALKRAVQSELAAQADKHLAIEESKRANRASEVAHLEKIASEDARDLAETRLYANKIRLAQAEWDHGDPAVAIESLNSTAPNSRGWEFDFLTACFGRSHQNVEPNGRGYSCVTLSPDGARFIAVGQDKSISIGRIDSKKREQFWRGHDDVIASCAVSPDGKQVASASFDRTVKIWNLDEGTELRTLVGHTDRVASVAFSPDGNRIASGSWDKTIILWDPTTGEIQKTLTGHEGQVYSIAFAPNGNQLASGSQDGTVRVWDLTGDAPPVVLRGHQDQVFELAYSPDGQKLASCSGDRTIKIWSVVDQTEVRTLSGHTEWVTSVDFSDDGQRIASGSWDKTIKIWDASSGENLMTLKGHSEAIDSLAFLSNSQGLVSAGFDGIKFWTLGNQDQAFTIPGHQFLVTSLAYSRDGDRIASASLDGKIKIWNASSRTEMLSVLGLTDRVLCVAFSSDGVQLASGGNDKKLNIWNAETGKALFSLVGHGGDVTCAAFVGKASQVVSGSKDGTLILWDLKTRTAIRTFNGHSDEVTDIAIAPSGKTMISSSYDKTIRIWDLSNGRTLVTLQGHQDKVTCVAYAPEGTRVVSGSLDRSIRVWDSNKGIELALLNGHTDLVHDVGWSPDGSRIVSASSDKTVKLWDTRKFEEIISLRGHDEWIANVTFSPRGNQLASCGYDNTIKIWETAPGKINAH